MKRILVCGGRDFNNQAQLERVLDQHSFSVLITGVARGADMLAYNYALHKQIPVLAFPADWKLHGKRAGYVRNARMLDEGKPDLVIAFPGGAGTSMMCGIAKAAGVQVLLIPEEGCE